MFSILQFYHLYSLWMKARGSYWKIDRYGTGWHTHAVPNDSGNFRDHTCSSTDYRSRFEFSCCSCLQKLPWFYICFWKLVHWHRKFTGRTTHLFQSQPALWNFVSVPGSPKWAHSFLWWADRDRLYKYALTHNGFGAMTSYFHFIYTEGFIYIFIYICSGWQQYLLKQINIR